MRVLIVASILFISFTGLSQSWLDDYTTMSTKIFEGDFESARAIGEELKETLEKNGVNDTSYTNVLAGLSYTYHAYQEYDKAMQLSDQEIKLRKEQGDTNSQIYVESIYYNAIYHSYNNDFEGTVQSLEATYRAYERTGIGTEDQIISVRYQLASIYDGLQQYQKSEAHYLATEKYLEATVEPLDSTLLTVKNAISAVYFRQGKYDEAEPYYLHACNVVKRKVGEKTESYLLSLNSLGEFYIYAGKYEKAEKTFDKNAELSKEVYGDNSADYATSLNNLAVAKENLNKIDEAISIYKTVLNIKEEVFDTTSDYYALSLLNLGVAYERKGDIIAAEHYVKRALNTYRKIKPEISENHATTLSRYAAILGKKGQNTDALTYGLMAVNMQKELYGENHQGYCLSLQSYAMSVMNSGNFKNAESLFKECIELQTKVMGEEHPSTIVSFMCLAQVESELSKVEEAMASTLHAKELSKRVHGRKSPEYARALNTEANIYFQTHQYTKCRGAYNQALKLFKSVLGEDHLEYATVLNNIALFYTSIGDYNKSLEYLQQAMAIQKKHSSNPEALSGMIYTLNNFSNNYASMDDFAAAEKALNQSESIALDLLGDKHPDYTRIIMNKANLYADIGVYDKSISLYKKALATQEEVYGKNSIISATTLNNMATVYLYKAQSSNIDIKGAHEFAHQAIDLIDQAISITKNNHKGAGNLAADYNNLAECYRVLGEMDNAVANYDKAIAIERENGTEEAVIAVTQHNKALALLGAGENKKALEIAQAGIKVREEKYGVNSPVLRDAYLSLAQIYIHNSMMKEAGNILLTTKQIFEDEIETKFSYFSEKEKLAWLETNGVYLELNRMYAYSQQDENPEFLIKHAESELKLSGLLLRSSERMKHQITQSNDPELLQNFNAWQDAKRAFALSLDENLSEDSLQNMRNKIDLLEKTLSEQTKNTLIQDEVNLNSITQNLGENEYYVQFSSFNWTSDSITDRTYFALVYKNNDKQPDFIKLCSEHSILKHFNSKAATRKKGVDQLYGKGNTLNAALGKSLLDSLLSEMPLNSTVFYTPDGILHKISFAALAKDDSSYFSDNYNFVMINDPLSFFKNKRGDIDLQKFELIGAVDYGQDGDWKYLDGTESEIQTIHGILSSHNKEDRLRTQSNAKESTLLEDIAEFKPDALHIASHGFFYPDPDEIIVQEVVIEEDLAFRGSNSVAALSMHKNPMLRSGIVLAGANNVESNSEGILSAYEVAMADLSSLQLVVLSACETGLGDVSGSQGVYGLQRAFKMSGVNKLVMSLWQVPDKETAEFMTNFYRELSENKSVEEAFSLTQKGMKVKYDPYFWAAFTLVN